MKPLAAALGAQAALWGLLSLGGNATHHDDFAQIMSGLALIWLAMAVVVLAFDNPNNSN